MSFTPARLRTLLLLSLVTSSAAAQSLLGQNNEVLLGVGDAAPGVPGATIFATSNFDSPVLDQNGTVVFRARMTGAVTGANDRAYFYGRGKNDMGLLVRAADQAPGCPAGTLLRSSSATAGSVGLGGTVRISPFGELFYFQCALYDPVTPANTPTTADSALFWGPASGITLLVREGDPVPFLAPGITWGAMTMSLQNNVINATGQSLFSTTLLGAAAGITTANDAILVVGTPGSLATVSREGDVLAGGEVVVGVSGNTLSFINQMNESGQVLHEMKFSSTLPSTATLANDRALAVWTAGTDLIIAREGQQAPGLPVGVLFGTTANAWSVDTGAATFTKSGNTAIQSVLVGTGITTSVNDRAIYYGGIGGLNLIMQAGSQAGGCPAGVTFSLANNSSITCNDSGQVAFVGFLNGTATATNDSGIWVGTTSGTTLIAREGDVAPSSVLAPSVNGPWTYSQFNGGTNNPLLNGRGDVMFQATVSDSVNSKNILLANVAGLGLRLVLDSTDTFTTAVGGPSTWTGISSSAGFNGGDGGQSHYNNSGDFVVRPNLTTGTAAIVRGHTGMLQANPASVPAAGLVPQNFSLDCGAANASQIYMLIGSLSGTRPGTPFPPITIPLNLDSWLNISLGFANTAIYTNTLGLLDGNGKATMSFTMPSGVSGATGLTLHHSAVLFDFFTITPVLATEPTALKFY